MEPRLTMQPTDATASRYDATTIALHWITALLVVAQWCVAQMIDWAPRGAPRVPMRSLHLSIGVVLVVLVVGRLAWRATRGRRLPAADPGPLHAVAKATHWGLYALLVTILGMGLALWWVRADTWFFLWSPPPANPADSALRRFLQEWHGRLANWVMILAGVHAAAALVHRYVWRDGVLARMVTRRV